MNASQHKCFLISDHRRLIHGVKVGLALSLSSLFMLVEKPPKLLGENAIWAIMTVVVVFEFSVGATLSKGLNRGLGTLAAAFVGLGVSNLADCFGHTGEATVIIGSIFITAAAATFMRLIPKVKAKFDYGLLIFILTFSLISISSYQADSSLKTASSRMLTIIVGCGISLGICMFVLPVWAGEDLHALLYRNFETLADCLQGTADEYLRRPVTTMQAVMEKEIQDRADNDEIYVKYRALLSSTQAEESLATFASWEPPHGKFFRLGYPWQQYVKVGAALRHCAYTTMALHCCVRAEVQAPYELRRVFHREILKVTGDAAELLKQLSTNIRSMERGRRADELLVHLTASTEALQVAIDTNSQLFVNPVMFKSMMVNNPTYEVSRASPVSVTEENPHQALTSLPRLAALGSYTSLSVQAICSASNFSVATFTSLLIETVARVEKLMAAVECLSETARFRKVEQQKQLDSGGSLRATNDNMHSHRVNQSTE